MSRPPPHTDTDSGYVLIVVIWTVAVLALIALAFTRNAQTYVRTAAHGIESARAEAFADSGISLAVLGLTANRRGGVRVGRFPVDGSEVACSLDNDSVTIISVQDTGGLINLNLARDNLLRAFFSGLGAEPDDAARFADTIMDYREREHERRPHGAEMAEYRAEGRAYGPKNAPFDSLEELHQVLGLTPDLITAMRPHVTIHSATAGLDPAVTRPELVDIVSRGRDRSLPSRQFEITAQQLPAEFVISSDQRSFVVRSEAHLASGAVYVREAVIELTPNRATPYRVKSWLRGRMGENGDGAARRLPPATC